MAKVPCEWCGKPYDRDKLGDASEHMGCLNALHQSRKPTLRDQFAMAVLPEMYRQGISDQAYQHPEWLMGISLDAYRLADSMLVAREVDHHA